MSGPAPGPFPGRPSPGGPTPGGPTPGGPSPGGPTPDGPTPAGRARGAGAPEGYRIHRAGTARAIALAGMEGWIDSALGSADGVHGWASTQDERGEFAGRGRVHVVPAPMPGPDGRSRWAVRHYCRGGAMAFLGDRYHRLGRSRPERELDASIAARSRGIRTPAVICAAVYPDGLYYRADLVTEVVPDARTLAQTLHDNDGTRGWLVAMARAGALIRQLSESAIFHVDLNAHNLLLTEDPAGDTWVVDLDRARVLRRPSASARERMQARLTRSIVKIGTPTGEHLSHREVESALGQRTAPW